MPTRPRVHIRLLVGLLAATLGCSRDSIAGNSLEAVGHWTLQTYNGSALPAVALSGGSTTVEVMSGALELGSDGTYQIVTSYRMTQNGVVTLSSDPGAGSWVDRGSQITLSRGNGVPDAAAVYAGSRLTLYAPADNGGLLTIVYMR